MHGASCREPENQCEDDDKRRLTLKVVNGLTPQLVLCVLVGANSTNCTNSAHSSHLTSPRIYPRYPSVHLRLFSLSHIFDDNGCIYTVLRRRPAVWSEDSLTLIAIVTQDLVQACDKTDPYLPRISPRHPPDREEDWK